MDNETAITPTNTVFLSEAEQITHALKNDPKVLSDHSRRQYRSNLLRFDEWREGQPLTKPLVESYVVYLIDQRKLEASTVCQHLAAIRWYARRMIDFAFQSMPPEQAERLSRLAAQVLTIEDIKGDEDQIGRHLLIEERDALINSCGNDNAGIRNKALLWLAWTNGLRVGTIASLTMRDLRRTSDAIRIKYVSKRKKRGEVILKKNAREAMLLWLKVRGTDPGPVFLPVNKSGDVTLSQTPMSTEALRKILRGIVESADVEHLTWHYFRHTLLGNVIEKYDIKTAQRIGGHSSIETTAKYDWRPKKLQEQAIEEFSE